MLIISLKKSTIKEDSQEDHSPHYLPSEVIPTVNEEGDNSTKGKSSY